jgi:predicted nicotinamide N-methyase
MAKGSYLDVGCGTGICGFIALLLGADEVCFTDIRQSGCYESNLEQMPPHLLDKQHFVEYNWSQEQLPDELLYERSAAEDPEQKKKKTWDVLLCSDIVYGDDASHHRHLIRFLQALSFRRAIFSYKRRHDDAERAFFVMLESWCRVERLDLSSFPWVNLRREDTNGLFLFLVEPRGA